MSRLLTAVALILFSVVSASADTKVCNRGSIDLSLAYVRVSSSGIGYVSGWYRLPPGDCRSESMAYYLAIGQRDSAKRFGIANYPIPGSLGLEWQGSHNTYCVDLNGSFSYTNLVSSCGTGMVPAPFFIRVGINNFFWPSTLDIYSTPNAPMHILVSSECEEFNQTGFSKFERNDLAGALADFSKAVSADATCALAWMNRGMVYFLQQNWQAALSDLNRAAALPLESKFSLNTYLHRAFTKMNLNDLAGMGADCDRVAALDARAHEAFSCKASHQIKLNRPAEALATIERHPDFRKHSATLSRRAEALELLGRRAEALVDCKDVTVHTTNAGFCSRLLNQPQSKPATNAANTPAAPSGSTTSEAVKPSGNPGASSGIWSMLVAVGVFSGAALLLWRFRPFGWSSLHSVVALLARAHRLVRVQEDAVMGRKSTLGSLLLVVGVVLLSLLWVIIPLWIAESLSSGVINNSLRVSLMSSLLFLTLLASLWMASDRFGRLVMYQKRAAAWIVAIWIAFLSGFAAVIPGAFVLGSFGLLSSYAALVVFCLGVAISGWWLRRKAIKAGAEQGKNPGNATVDSSSAGATGA